LHDRAGVAGWHADVKVSAGDGDTLTIVSMDLWEEIGFVSFLSGGHSGLQGKFQVQGHVCVVHNVVHVDRTAVGALASEAISRRANHHNVVTES
jgi:hypothetical protein